MALPRGPARRKMPPQPPPYLPPTSGQSVSAFQKRRCRARLSCFRVTPILGKPLGALDPPKPPPKAFAKKEEKRHKRARAKTIDAVDFMAERQLHSGGVILASGAALHVGEDSCAAHLFGLIVTFDQKNEPKSPKKRPGAKRTTNCTATLGGLRRIDSSIYILFDKHAQTFFM